MGTIHPGRQKLVQIARSLVGSHYLWGSAGATPGNQDGAAYRAGRVTLETARVDPNNPCVFAAACSVDGYFLCAGRFRGIPGGRPANPADWDLQNYLRTLPADPALWQPYFRFFTPRRMTGKNVPTQIVWGEDCRGKRHFDCISFINYCLSKVTVVAFSASIPLFNTPGWNGIRDVGSEAVLEGDIVLSGSDHIGFATGDGKVVQAQEAAYGVTDTAAYVAANWTKRVRLPDSLFTKA